MTDTTDIGRCPECETKGTQTSSYGEQHAFECPACDETWIEEPPPYPDSLGADATDTASERCPACETAGSRVRGVPQLRKCNGDECLVDTYWVEHP